MHCNLSSSSLKADQDFGPSGAVQTVSDSRRPLFLVIFPLVVAVVVPTVPAFTPEGIVVGFQIFAWAPN